MAKLDKSGLCDTPLPNPIPPTAFWKEIPLKECGEKLVPLGLSSDYPKIFTDSIYFGERENSPYPTAKLEGSLITAFVRESVAKALHEAQELLLKNLHLVIFDSYRTLEVQRSLYDQYYEQLKQVRPTWSKDELAARTQRYIAVPSNDPARPFPHNTGGSVDVAIYELPESFDGSDIEAVQTQGKLLNFGTPLDHGGKEAALDYFEHLRKERILSPDEEEAMQNRRMLYWIMAKVGLESFEGEWWHFNSRAGQMGARASGMEKAIFGGAGLSAANLAHEERRKAHYFERMKKFDKGEITVSPRMSSFPRATAIAPCR